MSEDSPEGRAQAARRYLATIPVIEDLFDQGFRAVEGADENERAAHMRAWRARAEAIEHVFVQSLTEHFTADEIDALARFQASPEGRAIMRKQPVYVAGLLARMEPLVEAINKEIYGGGRS